MSLFGDRRECADIRDLVDREAGAKAAVLGDEETLWEAVARDPEDGREIENGQDLASKMTDAQDGAVCSRHGRQVAELCDLDHVLDCDRVGLAAQAYAHMNRAHDRAREATPDSASPVSACSSFLTRSSTLSALARRRSCSVAS